MKTYLFSEGVPKTRLTFHPDGTITDGPDLLGHRNSYIETTDGRFFIHRNIYRQYNGEPHLEVVTATHGAQYVVNLNNGIAYKILQ